MAGLIYLTDVDDLDTAITSKFGQVYSKYGDSVMATLGIDIVQVCPISFLGIRTFSLHIVIEGLFS